MRYKVHRPQRGFTLVEVLVVVGIIGLFLGMSALQLGLFWRGSYVQNTARETAATLQLAQSKTLGSQDASQYGVYFDTQSNPHRYTLFQGLSYDSRNIAQDEITLLNKEIEISSVALGGASEVVFVRLSGQASVEGQIVFRQIADPTNTRTITILSSGVVEEGAATVPSDASRIKDSRHVHVPYQGRTIATSSESVRLIFPDTTFSFVIAGNMSAGQILWEGDVVSQGETQHVKVHTHMLNDPAQGTQFCVHRDRSKNTKSLQVELSGDVTGNLIFYDTAGAITQGTSIYALPPDVQ
jgi:prepilin-type N-terminal cleavage/methylation domain-containing protein